MTPNQAKAIARRPHLAAKVLGHEPLEATPLPERHPKLKWLRHPNVSKQCIHLDPHKLTNEEAHGMAETAFSLDTSCRGCNGNTQLQKCHGGSGKNGFTTVSWCSYHCTKFQGAPAPHVDS